MQDKLPELFLERTCSFLPEKEHMDFIESFDKEAVSSIRINSLKTNAEEFWPLFDLPKYKTIKGVENGFNIERKGAFTKTPFYHAGLFYVQEASSMIPVELLEVEPGDVILDSCASPGSKTTQLICKMKNQGLLIANEIRRDRVGRLIENVSRWGAKNCVITNQASNAFRGMENFFDKILVDAPCSGEGMFRKDPDTLKYWSLNNIKTCAGTQKTILKDLLPTLKVGGTLVYSTCTMAPEENEETIDWVLANYPDCFEVVPLKIGEPGISSFEDKKYSIEVEKTRRIWPHKNPSEGFFVAKLKKIRNISIDEKNEFVKPKKLSKNFIQKPNQSLLQKFFKELGLKKILNIKDVFQIGYKIYSWGNIPFKALLDFLPDIKPVYMGVHLGNEKKKRIEPAHSLALSVLKSELPDIPHIDLNLKDSIEYLRGQEITGLSQPGSGFHVVTHKEFPIGWGNYKQQRLKNFFPKGMRNKL